jgi:acyl-CoA dehydrogenase
MEFTASERSRALRGRLEEFMAGHVHPSEQTFWDELASASDRWAPLPLIERLKDKAREEGLWNLFLPAAGLSNLEYAPLAEVMGRVHWASVVFNCSAPDTGNMEVLERFGTPGQKREWLEPLLDGRIRSAFSMTEPAVASSDATNIETQIRRDGGHYVINGRKWFTSGAGFRDCAILIVMGKTDPDNPDRHRQQSMILVPRDTPGVTIERSLPVFGWDEAPYGHAEVTYRDVRVPAENLLLGEGRGFEIAQARLGPGRIHHCMRIIGSAEVALARMCRRLKERTAFGRPLASQSVWHERIAEARIAIDQCRLLTLHAADRIDKAGVRAARKEIGMIKIAAPSMLCRVVDWAIQAHGAAGVTEDFGLSYQYARARVMRIVDGPDEVHRNQVARLELAGHGERA